MHYHFVYQTSYSWTFDVAERSAACTWYLDCYQESFWNPESRKNVLRNLLWKYWKTVRNATLAQKHFEFFLWVLQSFLTAYVPNFQDIWGFYPFCNCPANCNGTINVGVAYKSHGATMYRFYSQACIMQIFIEMGEVPAHPEATALLQDAITIYDTLSETFFSHIVNEDVVVVLRSFLKIEELKLSMNLIYYRNITPNSQALGNGIFTSVDRGTHQARKRVVSAIHWMTVTYNKPTARMMRCLRSRLYSIQPIHSMFFNRIIFNPLISFLFSFISIG